MNRGRNRGLTRRQALVGAVAGATVGALPGCKSAPPPPAPTAADPDAVMSVHALGFPWETFDPFLFCVHHDDAYPEGNDRLGPGASLTGRDMGQDFAGLDGWRMYHGSTVPGFPQHPHRGFETVTIVRRGLVDHSDSLGATARYGHGDVQWLTAGSGIVHAEMFPLVERDKPNPLELFQVWLNLPREDKFAAPYFSMLWRERIPTHVVTDANGRRTSVTIIAGTYGEVRGPESPKNSWATRPDSDVAIWTLKLDAEARFTLPAAKAGTNRAIYAFRGTSLGVGSVSVPANVAVRLRGNSPVELTAGDAPTELLLLQGKPIGEPVFHRGPFVMNSEAEIRTAYSDYSRTRFGGWPWKSNEPVHEREAGRFAIHPDGRTERAG